MTEITIIVEKFNSAQKLPLSTNVNKCLYYVQYVQNKNLLNIKRFTIFEAIAQSD